MIGAYHASPMVRDRLDPVIEFVTEAREVGFSKTTTTDFRPLTWLDSLDMIAEKPLTGYGPGGYRYLYPEFRKRFTGAGFVSGHPHNEYLEIAAEYGWIGFAIFALGWMYGSIRLLIFSLKTTNEHHAFLAMAFLGTVAGTMFHSFFDFQMHVFQNALVFALLAAIAVGPMVAARRRDRKSAVGGQRSEVGGQRSEDRSQRSEVGGQRSAVGGQGSAVGSQRSEDRGQRSEDRGLGGPSRPHQPSTINSTTSAAGSAYLYPSQDETGGLDVGDQRSEVRGQRSAVGGLGGPSRPHQPSAINSTTMNASTSIWSRVILIPLTLLAAYGLIIAVPSYTSAFIRAAADRIAEAGNTDKAVAYYEKAIQWDDTNWRAYKGYGALLEKRRYYTLEPDLKNKFAKAELAVLKQGYVHNPKDAELVAALGKSMINAGRASNDLQLKNEGLAVLQQVTVLRPFNDNYWWTLGVEQRKAGLHEEALETFVRAYMIRKTPSTRKNIEWLKRQLAGSVGPQPVVEPEIVEKPVLIVPKTVEVEPESEDDSLDALLQLMGQ